jgi:uncharacterized MAPEG superfamily protein
VFDVLFIVAVILYVIFYLFGKARVEDVVVVTALGVLWIMIRLIVIQYTVDKIENQVKQVKREERRNE